MGAWNFLGGSPALFGDHQTRPQAKRKFTLNKVCIILRGWQGSGKSTFARDLFKNGFSWCSADFYFELEQDYDFDFTKLKDAHNFCKDIFCDFLRNNDNIVVDNTNAEIFEYKFYVDKAKEAGYDVRVVNCFGNFENVHAVPSENVEKKKLQVLEAKRMDGLIYYDFDGNIPA